MAIGICEDLLWLWQRALHCLTCGAITYSESFIPPCDARRIAAAAKQANLIYDKQDTELIRDAGTDADADVILADDADGDGEHDFVVFRGTQSCRDWVMNIVYRLSTEFDPEHYPGVRCHSGFNLQWQAVSAKVLERLEAHDKSRLLTVTGHSLGGGLASLAALELRRLGYRVEVVTCGSPRVLNSVGARTLAELGIEVFRVKQGADIVTVIPVVNLQHIAPEINVSLPYCLGRIYSVLDHSMTSYADSLRAYADRISELGLEKVTREEVERSRAERFFVKLAEQPDKLPKDVPEGLKVLL